MANQDQVTEQFEQMWQQGETPWKQHGSEPELAEFFEVLKQHHPAARVLDLGCGDGWIAIKLAKQGHEVWGIDSSETAIERAIEKAKQTGVSDRTHFQVGDALKLPYENHQFDALIDRGLFHHIVRSNYSKYFNEVTRVLKPGGLMFLAVFSKRNRQTFRNKFTRAQIEQLFDRWFRVRSYAEDQPSEPVPAYLAYFILERLKP